MLKLKHIAAYFLLLVYGVSFGHQIIPHHHHEQGEQHGHQHPEVHDHCVAEKESHDHVAHENHFDEGFIDFLACILSNHAHNPTTDCEFVFGVNDQKNSTKKSIKIDANIGHNLLETGLYLVPKRPAYLGLFDYRLNAIAFHKTRRGPPAA